MMCYADDTLHIPSSTSLTRTQKLMEMAVAAISTMIRYLGLEVALTETKSFGTTVFLEHEIPPQLIVSYIYVHVCH